MHSIEVALAVDFARRGITAILVALLVMISLPLWLFAAMDHDGILVSTSREAVALHVTLTLALGFGAAVAVYQAQGQITRFFVRPVSTQRLVACQMLLAMSTIAVMYLCAASLINLRGADWPLIGPALFLATALACSLAVIWTLEGSVIAQLAGCLALNVPLAIWFNRCYGATIMGEWKVMWHQPTAMELMTLLAISAAAYVVAVVGVKRTRRGDVVNLAWVVATWDRLSLQRRGPARFPNPLAAHLWCQWQQKMCMLPAYLVAFFFVLMLTLRFTGFVDMDNMLQVLLALPLMHLLLIFPLLFGLMLGNSGNGQRKGEMKFVFATLPVTDGFLAKTILWNCGQMLAWAWGVWLIGLVIIGGFSYLSGYETEVKRAFVPEMPSIVETLPLLLLPLTSWTIAALVATVVSTGRLWLFFTALVTIFTLGLGLSMLQGIISPQLFEWIILGGAMLSGTLYILVSLWAFVAAYQRRHISSRDILLGTVFWIVTTLVVVLAWPLPQSQLVWLWHCLGCLALSVLPIAAMPLAVHWNRHR